MDGRAMFTMAVCFRSPSRSWPGRSPGVRRRMPSSKSDTKRFFADWRPSSKGRQPAPGEGELNAHVEQLQQEEQESHGDEHGAGQLLTALKKPLTDPGADSHAKLRRQESLHTKPDDDKR